MEEQITNLTAELAALTAAYEAGNTAFAQMYYYLAIPLMILMLAGFLARDMGATRVKNVLSSGIKNILAFAFIVPTFYYVGWFVYWAFPTGIDFTAGANGTSGWALALANANPIGQAMGPNLSDNLNGVFWGVFTLFAAITVSIMSGAVIERIRIVAFVVLAVALGSFTWVIAAAWGWNADGWLVTQYGYHDFGAAGPVHAVAGFFALGVLINLGPRIGKFNVDGSANSLPGHSLPFTLVGLMLIIAGFWGFLMASVIVPGEAWSWSAVEFTSIYGTPVTLSALTFNILMGLAGGTIGAWMVTRDPFWMLSGALGGIISCAAGLDVWWPPMAFVIGFIGGCIIPVSARFFEKIGIDDAVGAVTVHGTLGLWGILAVGIFASGYPALPIEGGPVITLTGQLIGAAVMFLLGFIPGYVLSLILRMFGILRFGKAVEIAGLDPAIVPGSAYPEGIPASPPSLAH